MTLLQPIGTLSFSLGAALTFLAGWMRLCDSGSDLASKVLGAGVTLLLLGWLVMEVAGMANRTDFRTSFPAA